VTAISGSHVSITWTIPFDGSSSITGYLIKIRESDGVTFTEDSTDCNGLESAIITGLTCSVPIATLIIDPYNEPWGASIYATVSAINIVGTSTASPEGNGAIILTNPDAPTTLANDAVITLGDQIGLTYLEGAANGGSPVIDYRVSQAEEAGVYSVIASGITTLSYTATDLTPGTTYKFKVESRNEYDYSEYSGEVLILAAEIPATPTAPTTSINGDLVDITWSAPNAMGSPIIAYSISIRTSDDVTYAIDYTGCDGSDAAIVSSATCSVQISILRASSF
jgi:hypothetical protein